jgi:phage baseplate assembly protein W
MPVREEKTEHLLRDLAIHAVHRELRPVYRVNERLSVAPNGREVAWDFITRDGKENLAQAVILRLLTPRGELNALGHPQYGARVHELIGRENNATTRNLLKLYVLDALQHEPRIEQILELKVTSTRGNRSAVDVLLRVLPVGVSTLVQIGPFSIDLAT